MCKHATAYLIDGFPCRVCGAVFHYQCLKKSELYSEAELAFVLRAKTPVGWSCEQCVSSLKKPIFSAVHPTPLNTPLYLSTNLIYKVLLYHAGQSQQHFKAKRNRQTLVRF